MKLGSDKFNTIMGAMKEHYISNPDALYQIQNSVIFMNHADNAKIPDEVEEQQNAFKLTTDNFSNNQNKICTDNSKDLTDKKVEQSEFEKIMNQNKEDAKTKATKAIDDYYQKMIDIGNKHPEAQSQIITIVNKTTAFFMGVLKSIQDFIVKLVDNIIKWAKEVFNKITEHFSVIAKAAISFFSGVLV